MFVFAVIAFGLMYSCAYSHEKIHQDINRFHGINSTIHMSVFYAYCETTQNITLDQQEAIRPYHIQNEFVGYSTMTIAFAVILAAFLIGMALLMSNDEKADIMKALYYSEKKK